MLHRIKIVLLVILGLAIAAPEIPVLKQVIAVDTAHAQKKKRRTLFDLFKSRRKKRRQRVQQNIQKKRNVNRPSNRVRKTQRPRTAKRKTTTQAPKPAVIATKNENAAKILVVGDFIASGIARELTRLYQSNPNVVIESRTSAASGIVRYDVVNWEEELPKLLEEKKPAVMVNLLGMNDRQAMRLPDGRVKELSEPWLKAYSGRIEKISSFSPQYKVPLLWVGLPPVRFSNMNTDYLTFNELYRTKVEAVNGTFIDVWDGFTNEQGKFVSAGPDVNGQIVRLRGSKGINMTRAGFRKLAFYVDKELRKFGISEDEKSVLLTSLNDFAPTENKPAVPQYDPVGSGTTVVIPLGKADPNGGSQLAGADEFLKSEGRDKSVSFNLVEKGIGYEPKTGRIDSGWGVPAIAEKPKDKEKADADSEDKTKNPTAAQEKQSDEKIRPQAKLAQ